MFELFKVVASELSSAAKLVVLNARGLGDEEEDDTESEAADEVAHLSPLGLLVMPHVRASLRTLVARIGGPVELAAVALWDKAIAHSPAPEVGETRVYAAKWPGVCVRLLDGLIELRVGAPAGVVKLAPDGAGWANKSVARVDDTTGNGTLTIVGGGAAGAGTLTATYVDANGLSTPVGVITVTDPSLVSIAGTITVPISGKITSGSSSVKA